MKSQSSILLLVFAFGVSIATTFEAYASHGGCYTYSEAILEMEKLEQVRVTASIDQLDQIVETFTNPETRQWSLMITKPNNETCIIAWGEDFIFVAPNKVVRPNPFDHDNDLKGDDPA